MDSPLQQVISALGLHCDSTREEVDCKLKAEKCAGKNEERKEELEDIAKSLCMTFSMSISDQDYAIHTRQIMTQDRQPSSVFRTK